MDRQAIVAVFAAGITGPVQLLDVNPDGSACHMTFAEAFYFMSYTAQFGTPVPVLATAIVIGATTCPASSAAWISDSCVTSATDN